MINFRKNKSKLVIILLAILLPQFVFAADTGGLTPENVQGMINNFIFKDKASSTRQIYVIMAQMVIALTGIWKVFQVFFSGEDSTIKWGSLFMPALMIFAGTKTALDFIISNIIIPLISTILSK